MDKVWTLRNNGQTLDKVWTNIGQSLDIVSRLCPVTHSPGAPGSVKCLPESHHPVYSGSNLQKSTHLTDMNEAKRHGVYPMLR